MNDTDLTNTLAQRKNDKPKIYREIADEAKAAKNYTFCGVTDFEDSVMKPVC